MIDDRDLIDRVISCGDQHAFKTLVLKHQSSIRNFARRLTAGCHATADDIAQETFLSAFRSIDTFRGQSSFSTWLHTIAHRHFLAMLKRQQKVEVVGKEKSQESQLLVYSLNSEDKSILIEQLMSLLNVNERVCITLFSLSGLTHQEISYECNMPLGTVKSHIKRATEKMQRALNEK